MEFRQLTYFVRVVDTGSFSRAAVALHVSQSNLSRQIASLESELGQRLLVRNGRGVTASEAGVALRAHAGAILQMVNYTREELQGLQESPKGRVVVGLPAMAAQLHGARLVELFRASFPQAVLTISEGASIDLRQWVANGRLDIALMFDPPSTPMLDYEVLNREPLVLVAPLKGRRPLPAVVPLETLPLYPLILTSPPNALRRLVDSVLEPLGIKLNVIADSHTARPALAMVAIGLGCTILPRGALALSERPDELQSALLGPPSIHNSLVMGTPHGKPMTRLVRETAQMLRAVYN